MNVGPILKTIRALGYRKTTHRVEGGTGFNGQRMQVPDRYVEMHAVKTGKGDAPDEVQIARVDYQFDEAEYRCACLLAQAVGIDLEDG